MSTSPFTGGARRLLLVDLDWRESDLVPSLLRDGTVSVALVAGVSPEDPGVRVAKLCGLPYTSDLADLTRQIFDLAVVGAGSPRRAQIERLLAALGTPVVAPEGLVAAVPRLERRTAETGAIDIATQPDLEAAFPDVSSAPSSVDPMSRDDLGRPETIPPPDDPAGLERWLAVRRARTSSSTTEIHVGTADAIQRTCRLGPEDLLLDALVALAARIGTPQVVERLDRMDPRRAWGAWPFRCAGRSVVLAAAGFDPLDGPYQWERAAEQLRLTWTSEVNGPQALAACLPSETFTARVRLAVERHRREPFPFAVHRLRFDGPPAAVDALCAVVPARLRATDGMCRIGPLEALLLFSGGAAAYGALRRRLAAEWEGAWRETGEAGPARPIMDERIALDEPARAADFFAATEGASTL